MPLKVRPVLHIWRSKMLFLLCLSLLLMAFTPLARHLEQRATIKFLQKTGKSAIEIRRSLRPVYGTDTLSKTQVRQWFSRFRSGDMTTTTKDMHRPGRPCHRLRYRQQIQNILAQDHCLTLDQISAKCGLSQSSVHRLLKKDLKMSKVSPKFVPRLLTDEQKRHRMDLCRQNLDRLKADNTLLEKIITTDESWFSVFEPDTKQDSLEWRDKGGARPKKAIRNRAVKKKWPSSFLTQSAWCTSSSCLQDKQTMDSDFWIGVLKRMKESLRQKRPIMWKGGFDGQTDRDFVVHMDNVPIHVSIPSLAFYGEEGIDLLAQPAYSLDLAPCDFWAFPTVKAQLRGRRFRNLVELQDEIWRILHHIPKADFEQALYNMPVRWGKCLAASGEYFEGGNFAFNSDDLPQNSSSDEAQETDGEDDQ